MHELGPVDVGKIEALLKEREKTNDIPKQLLQLRIDAAEKNRRNKFQLVCQVRLKVYCVTTIQAREEIMREQQKAFFSSRQFGFISPEGGFQDTQSQSGTARFNRTTS